MLALPRALAASPPSASTPPCAPLLPLSRSRPLPLPRLLLRALQVTAALLPPLLTYPFLVFGLISPESWFRHGLSPALSSLGGCFTKFAQWAATRPDLFPEHAVSAFAVLQDGAPVHGWRHSEDEVVCAFGGWGGYERAVEYMEVMPVASGTVAQVHRVRMRDGREVAVKVLHPGIEGLVECDLGLLGAMASVASWMPGLKWLSLPEAVEIFATSMTGQLDMKREARNLDRLRDNAREWGRLGGAVTSKVKVTVPTVALATDRVLAMSFERGIRMGDYLKDPTRPAAERVELANCGFDSFLHQLLFQNFTHADLHPGNILVRLKGSAAPELVYLDAGLVCELTRSDHKNFVDLFMAMANRDARAGADLMISRSRSAEAVRDPEGFRAEMQAMLEQKVFGLDPSEVRVGSVMIDILRCVQRHHVVLDPGFATMVVSIVIVEGMGKELDPGAKLFQKSLPYLALYAAKNTKR